MNTPHSLREVFVCLDAPTNCPPLQAFNCSPLCRSARPPLQACDLRSYAPPARLCRRAASAFPPPPARPLGVRPAAGSASGRMTAPSPPPSAGSLRSALPPSLLGKCLCLRSAPTCQKRKLQKALPFTIFFSTN